MRALVRVPGGVAVAEVPDPRPGSRQVIVAPQACGICGSDVHAAESTTARTGGIPGHEFAGTIADVGDEVTAWQRGQRVAVNPLGGCGACEWCQRGLLLRCAARPNLGLSAPGGFAEYVAVDESQLWALPDELPLERGARVEPLAVGVRAIAEANPARGAHAIVFGVGPIGLHLIGALRALGCGTIVAVGRSSGGRRAAAATMGADVVLDSRTVDVADYVRDAGLDIAHAYECSGDSQALVQLSQAVRPAGTLVGVALGWTLANFDLRTFVSKGQRLLSACAYGNADFSRALDLITAGAVAVDPLISDRIPLAGAPEAFVQLRRPGNLVSVLVEPWR